ncbi:hypothetical protein PsorP6_000523 [Peronosclerospora sorghi]|uniref:Uncharacterized protein n=1 Tax=Peronosclerospora sorghi TaxID=230839 RepID=A0ACC0WUY8_9STRA|nr:hypothetical protein PsorP6_000523 [Peronosclerospora sorghi]
MPHKVHGTCQALTDKSIRKVFWRSIKVLLILALLLSALVHLVLLPVEWISRLFLKTDTVDATVRTFRYACTSTVPFLLVGICRLCSVHTFEKAFFSGLAARDARLAATIERDECPFCSLHRARSFNVGPSVYRRKPSPSSVAARHLMRFGLRQLAFGVVGLLEKPFLGLLISIEQFGYRYVFVYARRRWKREFGSQEAARSLRHMDMTFLVPLFAAFLVPSTRGLALEVVYLWLDARSIMRELLTPLRAGASPVGRRPLPKKPRL